MDSIDEKRLVALLNKGNRSAFHSLYNIYVDKLFYFISKYYRSQSDIEEATQNVFVKIWENHEKISPEGSFQGYLFQTAKNLIINSFKHKLYIESYKKYSLEHNSLEDNQIIKDIITKDLERYLYKLIDNMPERRKEVFILSRFEGMTYREIASFLGISENSVDTHIRLSLKYLRENIANF